MRCWCQIASRGSPGCELKGLIFGTTGFSGLVRAEVASTVGFHSLWNRTDPIATLLGTENHKGIAVLPHIIPCDQAPVAFAERRAGVAVFQDLSIAVASRIAVLGHTLLDGSLQCLDPFSRNAFIARSSGGNDRRRQCKSHWAELKTTYQRKPQETPDSLIRDCYCSHGQNQDRGDNDRC